MSFEAAETYISNKGWGARGKNLGVSRMFGDNDKQSLSRNTWFVAMRPRGLISGFLAILPNGGGAVYLPPIAAKIQPQRLRLRVSEDLRRDGAIFSAYMTHDNPRQLILEDVLDWRGEPVWSTKSFKERWDVYMRDFLTNMFINDVPLQSFTVTIADYKSLSATCAPNDRQVLEFIPDAASTKRLIWSPTTRHEVSLRKPIVRNTVITEEPAETSALPALPTIVSKLPESASASTSFIVKKEAGMGPDVYAIYRGAERLGLALVRTMAISRALRLACGTVEGAEIAVSAEYNKTFNKWEVLSCATQI
jgi:hypothetical protein